MTNTVVTTVLGNLHEFTNMGGSSKLPGYKVNIAPTGWDKDDDRLLMPEVVKLQTDQDSQISVGLWPNVRGVNATRYLVVIMHPTTSKRLAQFYITVPESATPVNLRDIISDDPPPPLSEATQAEQAAQQFASDAQDSALLAEGFRDGAQGFRDEAQTAAGNAGDSETAAGLSATSAGESADEAQGFRNESEGFRNDAETFADQSEQAAKAEVDQYVIERHLRDIYLRNQQKGVHVPPRFAVVADPYREGVEGLVFSRLSEATFFGPSGELKNAPADAIRLDYDPTTGAFRGALIEPERTNYLHDSFTPATQTRSLDAGDYTVSMSGSGDLELSGDATGTVTEGNSVTFTLAGAGSVTVTVNGSVDWFQLENGTFPTSPIITEGSPVTRSPDLAEIDLDQGEADGWFDRTQGTFVIVGEYDHIDSLVRRHPIGGDASTAVFGTFHQSGGQIGFRYTASSGTSFNINNVYERNTRTAIACAWSLTDNLIRGAVNGVTGEGTNNGDTTFPTNTMYLVRGQFNDSKGALLGVYYIPRLLSEAELAKITELP